MARIALVTDSTSDLTPEMRDRTGVTVVPLKIHFGDEVFLDGVDLTSDAFFSKLRKASAMPRTSQPSPGDFAEVYRRLADEGVTDILSVHISSALSGTFQSAMIARTMVEGPTIEVVDSRVASLGLGLLVRALAERLQAGETIDQLRSAADEMIPLTGVFFAIDTLEYLEKNGRIGRAQSLLGTLLSVKPLLTLDDGVVASHDKVRGKSKVIPRLVDLISKRVAPGDNARVVVAHGDCPEEAARLAEALRERYGVEPEVCMVGPVIGCHTGPGVLATAGLVVK